MSSVITKIHLVCYYCNTSPILKYIYNNIYYKFYFVIVNKVPIFINYKNSIF